MLSYTRKESDMKKMYYIFLSLLYKIEYYIEIFYSKYSVHVVYIIFGSHSLCLLNIQIPQLLKIVRKLNYY